MDEIHDLLCSALVTVGQNGIDFFVSWRIAMQAPSVHLQITHKQATQNFQQVVNNPTNKDLFKNQTYKDLLKISRRRLVLWPYRTDPSKCETQLGGWLASVIRTTDDGDPASDVRLLCPYSNADFRVGQFRADLEQLQLGAFTEGEQGTRKRDPLGTYARVVTEHLALIARYKAGECSWDDNLATKSLEWPAFRHKDCGYADTPEKYFDYVASHLERKQLMVLHAGRDKVAPPEDLMPAYGRRMLDRHLSETKGQLPPDYETREVSPWIKRAPMRLPGYREKLSSKHSF